MHSSGRTKGAGEMDLSRIKRIALDFVARVYIANNVESELLDNEFGAWYYKQLQRYDPCNLSEISVALTEARRFEVAGFMTLQYGHVLIMTFETGSDTHVSEIFLRLSERNQIVEILPFRQTVH